MKKKTGITRKQAIKKMGKYAALTAIGTFAILNPKNLVGVDEFNQAIRAISVIDNEASSGKKEIEITDEILDIANYKNDTKKS